MGQHARQPRRRLEPSAPAKPELAFEPFRRIAHELPPLFEKQWRELEGYQDQIPLSPDWKQFFDYEAMGVLKVLTVRFRGELVGFIFTLLMPTLNHKKTLYAIVERFWLAPEYRKGWFPIKMFRENENYIRQFGPKLIMVTENIEFMGGRVGVIFKRLGYKAAQLTFSKLLTE